MTARPHPSKTPTARGTAGRLRTVATAMGTENGPHTRLPWWAVALPGLAFTTLLCLLASTGQADAAEQSYGGSVLHQLERLVHLVTG